MVMWNYAVKEHRLVDPDINPNIVSSVNRIIIIGCSVTAIITIIVGFVPWFGWLVFAPFAYVILAIAVGHPKPFLKG